MTTQQIIKKYGTPNETGVGYLVKIQLPYPMRLAWDTDTTVTTMMCHKLVADKLGIYPLLEVIELNIKLFKEAF